MQDRETASDDRLMTALRDGDLAALETLFRRRHASLYRYFRRVGRTPATSEDLVQESFLRMLRYRRSFRRGASFRTWMYRVARNVLVDHQARTARQDSAPADPDERPSLEPLPPERLEKAQSRRRLRRALDRLTAEQREVLVLSRYQDLRYAEIGRLLGCSVGAVKLRVHRALVRLGELLDGDR